ncbi:hypothetical protein C0992_000111, partial [Termitomyces sp. T32_za158]
MQWGAPVVQQLPVTATAPPFLTLAAPEAHILSLQAAPQRAYMFLLVPDGGLVLADNSACGAPPVLGAHSAPPPGLPPSENRGMSHMEAAAHGLDKPQLQTADFQ